MLLGPGGPGIPSQCPCRGAPPPRPNRAADLGAWGEPTDLGAGLRSGQLRCAGLSGVPPTSDQASRAPSRRPLTHRPANLPTSVPTGSRRVWTPRDGGGDPREAGPERPPPPRRDHPSVTPPPAPPPRRPAGTGQPKVPVPPGPAAATPPLRTCFAPRPRLSPAPPPRPGSALPRPASPEATPPGAPPRPCRLPLQHPSGPGRRPPCPAAGPLGFSGPSAPLPAAGEAERELVSRIAERSHGKKVLGTPQRSHCLGGRTSQAGAIPSKLRLA